jgi:hypothetical protein
MFIGGDLHAGALFDVTVDNGAQLTVPCLISSGISKRASAADPLLSTLFDQEFEVAPGISARLRKAVADYNYGVVQVFPTGHGAAINNVLVHKGDASTFGVELWLKPGP